MKNPIKAWFKFLTPPKSPTAHEAVGSSTDAEAQFALGVAYGRGEGVAKNQALAQQCFQKAAEAGHREAQYLIGLMLVEGLNVPQNYFEAIQWFMKAAGQGHTGAQCTMGLMYMEGRGLPQNDAVAVDWFREAAERDNPQGQYNLGAMYANGQGVAEDNIQAHKWFNLAISNSSGTDTDLCNVAVEGRALVAGRMTQTEIAEAQKLASEWLPEWAKAR